MNDNKTATIECPNCGHEFDMEAAMTHHFEEEFANRLKEEQRRLQATYAKRDEDLRVRERELRLLREQEEEILHKKLAKEKAQLENQLKLKFQEDFDSVLREKNTELKEVEAQLLKLREAEVDNARLRRQLSQQKKELELSYELEMTKRLENMEDEIAKRERSRLEMRLRDQDKLLQDQRKLIEELERKSEQKSGQLKGEVQELAIEEYLRDQFPLDSIEEIKKGARGADCLHIVNTRRRENLGCIYYESKRTKDFQPKWIEKLKEDMRDQKADVGVIVTQTMPGDLPRLGIRDGVWICTFDEFKGLAIILREMVVRMKLAVDSQENRGEKMEMMYQFLTSNEFKLYVEGIIDGFSQMQDDLQKERTAMTRIWKQREKQLQKVLENTAAMFGAVKGIAGAALPNIPLLDLPGEDEG